MKYIILGKSLKQGVSGNDSESLSVYFELGWEVVGSRIDFIKLLKTEDTSDIVAVTSSDRTFFYSKLFKNVLSYNDFLKINITDHDTLDDWTVTRIIGAIKPFSFLHANSFVDSEGKYIRHQQDYDEIFDGFDLSGVKIKKPKQYIVLGLRKRDHNNYKNFDAKFFERLISKIKSELTQNIFVVGYGTEEFCKEYGCVYIEKLADFVYLIKDKKKCISYITQSTGTAVLSLTCSEVPIHLLDNTGCSELSGSNAILGGKCIQFCKDNIFLYKTLDDTTINKIVCNE